MDTYELPCRIRTSRQKKRLVKTDRDKQLIKLSKRRSELCKQIRALPKVPLEKPYQSGWKRYFVLRSDIAVSIRAEFYATLLAKINTVEYHHDKTFKRKKRRRGRYGYEIKKHSLRVLTPYLWESSNLGLTEQEKACFSQVELYNVKTREQEIRYVFTEPWRYSLKIAPHMITHKKLLDTELVSEADLIENRIKCNNLGGRMHVLTNGRKYNFWRKYTSLAKYDMMTKIPKYKSKETYLELDF
ncbi:hypothetical protein [Pedobacter suwonensis]|uniref:hypothetical protein n=1 Tax=Pedobacter suwonensis TaxID=332999 RepID=UPI0011A09CEB|nr:hypothetical protein [Pedobacter suwonensis]